MIVYYVNYHICYENNCTEVLQLNHRHPPIIDNEVIASNSIISRRHCSHVKDLDIIALGLSYLSSVISLRTTLIFVLRYNFFI